MHPKGSYQLTVRQGPVPGKIIELAKDVITIGRDVNNDIVINDAEVSRTHVRLTRQPESLLIEDLGSTNGSFINGQRLTGVKPLRAGDMLGLGETVVLEVTLQRDVDATVIVGPGASAPGSEFRSAEMPPSGTPASTGPLGSSSSPEAPRFTPPPPAPIRDNRMLWIGGICGCLTLACLCLVAVAAGAVLMDPNLLSGLGF